MRLLLLTAESMKHATSCEPRAASCELRAASREPQYNEHPFINPEAHLPRSLLTQRCVLHQQRRGCPPSYHQVQVQPVQPTSAAALLQH